MAKKKESAVDAALRLARDVQPDLWQRTEAVARIIAPEAFEADWVVIAPRDTARLHELRRRTMQATAISKAHTVLTYLGVNTQTDWFTILTRMAEEHRAADAVDRHASK